MMATLVGQRRQESSDPFEATDLVVPNANMAMYVKLALAQRLGIAANVRVRFMMRYVREQVERRRPELRIIDRGLLRDLALTVLLDDGQLASPDLEDVATWIRQGGSDHAMDLRRVQLAERLSAILEEYTFSRPEMVARWSRDGGDARGVEGWQAALWRILFGRRGVVADRSRPEQETWITVSQIADHLGPEAFRDQPPLHVFGVSYVARTFHEFLGMLGKVTDVHVYTLNPCPEFLGEQGDVQVANETLLVDPGADQVQLAQDPCGALRAWARPGRENLHLLCGVEGAEPHGLFRDPLDDGRSLLRAVQSDIVRRVEAVDPGEASGGLADDGSVVVLATKGIRREIEAVADEIWSMIREDESLRFNDIAVIVGPASRDEYMPHIEAVFAQRHLIPHNIVDLDLAAASAVAEAALLLLDLPAGSFTRSEMARLLAHPACVTSTWDLEPEAVVRLCDDLGIYHGADRTDLQGTYVEEDLFNWDQGVRRLALGAFMTGERSGDERVFTTHDGAYLPHEISASQMDPAARFALLARSLVSDMRFVRDARLPFASWARVLSTMLQTYVVDPAGDTGDLPRCLDAIHRLAEVDVGGAPVSFEVAAKMATDAIGRLGGARGQHLADGVVVSTFVPMRAIPFEAVFLTGMGEGLFPARDVRDTLDLRSRTPRPGDVSLPDRDRYTFMETLLCTRRKLVCSYVARDPQTGDVLPFSPVVGELLQMCRRHVPDAPRALVLEQPLWRHEHAEGPIDDASREARLRALGDHLRRATGRMDAAEDLQRVRQLAGEQTWERLSDLMDLPALPDPPRRTGGETVQLSLSTIRTFLQCPLQGSARALLGLAEDRSEDLLDRDVEPFEVQRLAGLMMLRRAFEEGIGARLEPVDVYRELVRRQELAGRFPTGLFGTVSRRGQEAVLAHWQVALDRAGLLPSSVAPLRFGRAEEHARVERIESAIELDVQVPGPDGEDVGVRVSVHGRTQPVSGDDLSSLVLLARRPTGRWQDLVRHHVSALTDHAALAASGLAADRERQAHMVMSDGVRSLVHSLDLPAMTRDEALDYLQGLAAEMLSSVHAYLMPCEAVAAWLHARMQGSMEATVQHLLDSPWSSVSSVHGPVPHPERYRPPADREARRMIARRFGPLYDLPGEGEP